MTVTGMQEGKTYRVSTCGNTNFDTQISIYTQGGALELGYSDDWCGLQSEIYFTPINTGNFDILVDEYNCASNAICMDLEVELWYGGRPDITIPVVVHVVYNTPTENISDAQIQSQINVLNADFTRTNSDIWSAVSPFLGRSMDPMLQFCLAVRDPSGNPTNGIVRTSTPYTDFGTDLFTNCLGSCTTPPCIFCTSTGGSDEWDRTQYLNIWVCNLGGIGGFGFPMWNVLPPNLQGIGVVLDYRYTGTIGTVTPPNDLGRIGTHEVAHWLNLWHLWFNPANVNNTCDSDTVSDTPWQDGATSGIPTFPDYDFCSTTYPGIMFNNFMDYTDDAGKNMFTYGQVVRTEGAMFGPYLSLQSSLGCTPGTPPTANFSGTPTTGNAPLTVNFTDLSSNSPSSWNWSLTGGSPSSSTNQNPSNITYNNPGTYTVTLTADNGWGNDVETKTSYIVVNSGVGINELAVENAFTIHPNPTMGEVRITNVEFPITNVEVFDVFGRPVPFDFDIQRATLDIGHLPKGVYFVKVGNVVKKLILQ